MSFSEEYMALRRRRKTESSAPAAPAESGGYRDANLKDVTLGSLQSGYLNSRYGEESFKAMLGAENDKQKYQNLLADEKFRFTPGNRLEQGVSGAFRALGQKLRQWTDPNAIAAGGAAAGLAALVGQAGPQAALPEEFITVPAAFVKGMAAGSAASNFKIESGLAYNEMLENGVSEETARKLALGVGTGNAALDLLQTGGLAKTYKLPGKSAAAGGVSKRVLRELGDRGVDVARETAQEVAQEGVTIAGAQAASRLDKGEYAYSREEVGKRLADTAASSALSFGVLNLPAAARNSTAHVADAKPAKQTRQTSAAYQAASDDRLRGFIEKVRTLKNDDDRDLIQGSISTRTNRAAEKARELTGLNTTGYKQIIRGSSIQHIDRRHGANGAADQSMASLDDLSKIGFVLDNFTEARVLSAGELDAETRKLSYEWKNSDNSRAPLLRFSMPVDGGRYVVEAAPSGKAKALAVVSAYIAKDSEAPRSPAPSMPTAEAKPVPETPPALAVNRVRQGEAESLSGHETAEGGTQNQVFSREQGMETAAPDGGEQLRIRETTNTDKPGEAETLEAPPELEYNNPEKAAYAEELAKYLQKYPDSDERYFKVYKEAKRIGIKGSVVLPPKQKQAFILPEGQRDSYHIMHRMLERDLTDDDLRALMKSAKVMVIQRGGQRQCFIGEEGCCVITKSGDDWLYKTAWKKTDIDEKTGKILEAIRNVGL